MLTRVQCTVCGSIIHTTIQFHNKSQTVEASKRRVDVWTLHSSTSAVHRTRVSTITPFARSFVRSLVRSFIRSFVHSLARSFLRSLVRSFARSVGAVVTSAGQFIKTSVVARRSSKS